MDDSVLPHESMLPLSWIPTRGNHIPPCAVPALDGEHGSWYIARAFVEGEMRLGTVNHLSIGGARIIDDFGRKHVALEYEVLVCATSLRWDFPVEDPSPETPHDAVRTPHRQTSTFSDVQSPLGPSSSMKIPKFSPRSRGLVSSVDQPRDTPGSSDDVKYSIDPPPYNSSSDSPGSDSWVDVAKPRSLPIVLNKRENVQFEHLVQSHCFILLDDSLSMQQGGWIQAREALIGVANLLTWNGHWRGANIRFVHDPHVHQCVKTREEFDRVFDSVIISREDKPMAERVMQIFLDGLPLVHQTAQSLNVWIITDGIATDTQDLFDKIIHFCHQLDQQHVEPHMFRIHILQMGDDRKVVGPLHDFRDRVDRSDRNRHILNVTSFHRGRGLLNAQSMMKLLLASTFIPSEEDPDVPQRLPPAVIRSQYKEVDRIRVMGNLRRR